MIRSVKTAAMSAGDPLQDRGLTVQQLLRQLQEKNASLALENGKLTLQAKPGTVPKSLLESVRNHREEIVGYLQSLLDRAVDPQHVAAPIPRRRPGARIPLTHAQQQLWILSRYAEADTTYNMPRAYVVEGAFDASIFKRAIAYVLRRHEILRTTFDYGADGVPEQIVHEDYSLPVVEIDLRNLPEPQQQAQLQRLAQADASTPFDLRTQLPLRVSILPLSDRACGVLVNVHHIAADARSMELVRKEMFAAYDAYKQGTEPRLPPLQLQYGDYACWHRELMQRQFIEKELGYWKQQLAGLPEVHGLPLKGPRQAKVQGSGDSFWQNVEPEVAQGARQLCRSVECTPFMLLHSVFALVVAAYSAQRDVVVGTTITGCTHKELEAMVGLMVNVLVLRSDVDPNQTFVEFMRRNAAMILAAYDNQHVPFSMLVSELNPPRSQTHSPLFQLMISWPDKQRGADHEARDGAVMRPMSKGEFTPKNELEIVIQQDGKGLRLRWDYRQDLFERELVERMAATLARLLKAVTGDASARVADLLADELGETGLHGKDSTTQVEQRSRALDASYVAATTATEAALTSIWQEVLEIESVGVVTNFFDVGGNSLRAILMLNAANETFQVELGMTEIFNFNTIRDLARHIDSLDAQSTGEGIPVVSREQPLPLSFAQQRLWFIDRLEGGGAQYNIPAGLRLSGALNLDALQASLDAIIERHDILRTTYAAVEGEAKQVVHAAKSLPLWRVDLSSYPPEAQAERISRLRREESGYVFDLASEFPIRAGLVRLSEESHVLLLTQHHIASDAWSMQILTREIEALYASFCAGEPSDLQKLPIQYADYAHWQRTRMAEPEFAHKRAYWKSQLAGMPTVHSLPLDRVRPAQKDFTGDVFEQRLGKGLLKRLQALAAHHNASLFMVLQSAFAALLSYWSRERDIVMGSPIAGRTHKDVEPLIGFFVNTLVLRSEVSLNESFDQLLTRNRAMILDAFEHQEVPFDMLVEELQPERSLSHTPVFQILFSLNHDRRAAQANAPLANGLRSRELEWGSSRIVAKFDLTLNANERSDGLSLNWIYAKSLFDAATLRQLAAAFELLLERVTVSPGLPMFGTPLMTAANVERLSSWQGAKADHPLVCLHQLFEQQAATTPERTAVVFEGASLSCAELNARSNQLARYLRAQGLPAESRIGLCLSRSLDMIVAMLGTLKAGCAYVPIDPTYPADRLSYISRDSGVAFVLTQRRHRDVLEHDLPALCLDDAEFQDHLSRQGTDDVAGVTGLSPQSLAYVIYTSGTTGRPNGVAVAHHSVVNLAQNLRTLIGDEREGGWGWTVSFAFDGSLKGIAQLVTGRPLVIFPDEARLDPQVLRRSLAMHPLAAIDCTPSMLDLWLSVGLGGLLPDLVVGGEPITAELWARLVTWQQRHGRRAFNVYGPTETCVDSCWSPISGSKPNLGRPLANVQQYICDDRMNRVPPLCVGELYIGGAGVSRGYLNRSSLTAERFVPDPFGAVAGARLYRTGDLVRHLENGEIEYLGRADDQIKIRGFRIEPAEIASQLRQLSEVKAAAVIVRDTAIDRQLVAYFVPFSRPVDVAQLRSQLQQRLPNYAVPAVFVELDALPLTIHGKVDKRALPEPPVIADGGCEPGNETEAAVADIWRRELRLERVGVDQDFFTVGGHSLLAIRVANRLGERFGRDVPIKALFEHNTIRALAKHIALLDVGATSGISAAPREAPLPLSSAQQRLWFIDQLEGGSPQYNIPARLRLGGAVNVQALQASLDALVERHEILRTTYTAVGGEARQVVHAPRSLPLWQVDLSSYSPDAQTERLSQLRREESGYAFDLANEFPIRAGLVHLSEQDHVLLLTQHHIASDAWSMQILLRELDELYEAFCNGRPACLPSLSIQYADYARWQRARMAKPEFARKLAYWKSQLSGVPTVHSLPLDRTRPAQMDFTGDVFEQRLGQGLLQRLKTLAVHHRASLFMVLQSAFAALLSYWSREHDIVMGSPIAGRIRKDVEPLIGFFVNTLVLRSEISPSERFDELLTRNRAMILDAFEHQEVPFDLLVEELQPERSLSHTPVFQIMFALNRREQSSDQQESAPAGLRSGFKPYTGNVIAKFDLSLTINERADGLSLNWTYAKSLFEAPTLARLAASFELLLERIVEAPAEPLFGAPLVRAADAERMSSWQGAKTAHSYICLHQLFEAQAATNPERMAVMFEGESLSYAALNARANQLARYLLALGLPAESRVGLCIGRSLDMIVAILGTLKAGCAYVPLDPTYPAERLSYVSKDSGLALVLTQLDHRDVMEWDVPTVCLDDAAFQDHLRGYETNDVDQVPGLAPASLAYVIYTSGTIGRPNGVAVPHRAVVNLAENLRTIIGNECEGAWGWVASFAFDASVQALAQLVCGRPVVLFSEEARRHPKALRRTLEAFPLAVMDCTPSIVDLWLGVGLGEVLPDLVIGGEPISQDLWARLVEWQQRHGRRAFNVYGPTETCVDSCWTLISGAKPNIGRPLANVQQYVCDDQMNPVPPLCVGELYIGGIGVSRGYLERPSLTAERFVPDPFGAVAGARLYRTGDLVRYLANGELEYLGRTDEQVKIHGYRIELAGIATRLLQLREIKAAAVVVRAAAAGRQLVAYVVPAYPPIDAAMIKAQLKQWLPDYMVPAVFVELDELPLTTHGKIDKRALPPPPTTAAVVCDPSNETEAAIADIWRKELELDRVSTDQDFFALGGHSLLAIRIANRMAERLGRDVPIKALFEHNTIRDLAKHVSSLEEDVSRIPAVSRAAVLPLSSAQQRLWFIDRLEGGSPQYNIPAGLRLSGELNVAALQSSLDALIERHEILRTTYAAVDGEARQVVHAPRSLPLWQVDLSSYSKEVQAERLSQLRREEAGYVFDLANEFPIRAGVVHLSGQDHALLLTQHHIASDAWSMQILLRELDELYASFSAGVPSNLPTLPIQYADYAYWQRSLMSEPAFARKRAYWQSQLAGIPTVHSLPLDRVRPAQMNFAGDVFEQRLGTESLERLQSLAVHHNASLFMVLQSAFAALLSYWSRENDIVMGSPIAGRTHQDLEPLIGFFVNTLVLRSDVSQRESFDQLLRRNRTMILDAFEHQDVPFDLLVEELQPERSLSHSPVFQIMFALHRQERSSDRQAAAPAGLRSRALKSDRSSVAKFDLTLNVTEHAEGLSLHWIYATSLFERSTMARLAASFDLLLNRITEDSAEPLCNVPMVTAADVGRMSAWHGPKADYPSVCLHQLFEVQAATAPEHIAVVFEGSTLNYGALNARANQLARYLLSLHLPAESRVGLCIARGLDMIVAILGTLKAGCAYVPLDPSYPADRLSYISKDCGLGLVLTLLPDRDVLEGDVATVCLDDAGFQQQLCTHATDNVGAVQGLSPQSPAYVIYTSGTTGRPNGVAVPHGSAVNLVHCSVPMLSVGRESRVLQFATLNFDAASWEWSMALLNGASLHICPRQTMSSPDALSEFLIEQRITHAVLPPALLAYLQPDRPYSLQMLMVGGEACEKTSAWKWAERWRLLNGYGPTEATVCATLAEVRPGEPITIGKPLPNVRCYVLNEAMQAVPPGCIGELYIGGAGVSRGYLNRPSLTAERFVPDSFDVVPGRRMYRTGDLVRYLDRGELEYLGRTDEQVKIRGFRIEPGEIASQLSRLPEVKSAAVIVRGSASEKQLVAYVVAASQPFDMARLKSQLKQRLPDYMVPAVFVELDALPFTANGKLDKRALPVPPTTADVVCDPSNETEAVLMDIWRKELKLDRVGTDQDFFSLGGHSLLAIRIVNRIAERLGREVPIKALFEHSTIRDLASHIAPSSTGDSGHIPRVSREAALPLSSAQQRLWFIDQLEGGGAQYNISVALRLSGVVDMQALQTSLDALVERHEILRTTYASVEGEARQVVHAPRSLPLWEVEVSSCSPQALAERLSQLRRQESGYVFDLANEFPIRAGLVHLGEQDHALLLTQHHIASDAWSMQILLSEFGALYDALSKGRSANLPPLSIQYSDYAHWQRSRMSEPEFARKRAYWKSQLAGIPTVHSLPLDRLRPAQMDFTGGMFEQRLGKALLERLQALATLHNASLFMVLQSAFAALLSYWSRERDIVMGSPIAGRTHQDLEPLIGFFVNTLVLRSELLRGESFDQLLTRNRAMLLEAFEHQEVPFDLLVDDLQPERSLSHAPVFQIMFALNHDEAGAPTHELLSRRLKSDTDDIVAKFDLSLNVQERADSLVLSWIHAKRLFEPSTLATLAASFELLLERIVKAPEQPLFNRPLVTAADAERMSSWQGAKANYSHTCVHRLFEATVAATPERTAVVFEGESVCFAELNARANRLARSLLAQRLRVESRVGLCIGRSLDMIVAILGVWKAGCAYVPLDPTYPAERLSYISMDSGLALVLTQQIHRDALECDVPVVCLDDSEFRQETLGYESDDLDEVTGLSPASLAYVIYTSGTTGRPNGVAVAHRSVVNLAANLRALIGEDATDAWGWIASFAFDASLQAIAQLASGRPVVIFSDEARRDPQVLARWLAAFPLAAIDCTPSILESWLSVGLGEQLPDLVIGGEPISAELWTRLLEWQQHHGRRAFNVYGPTETCVDSCWALIGGPKPNIGRPLSNVQQYVCDEQLNPVPPQCIGELYIGGVGVSRGYLNRPSLTAERFVPDPFAGAPGCRMYRTGDLVRYLQNGELEYLGRVDDQVKIRGFRIELSEIESRLHQCSGVAAAAVVLRRLGDRQAIVGYIVPTREGELSSDAQLASDELSATLREELNSMLPDFMVPAFFVIVAKLPITVHGKIDRRSLPTLDFAAATRGDYTPPQNEIQALLCELWQRLLRVPRLGIDDNFFALGGDSILAMQIVAAARKVGVSMRVRQLFEHQTIRTLSYRVDATTPQVQGQSSVTGPLQLLPVQKRFLAGGLTNLNHYNLSVLLETTDLTGSAVQAMIGALYQRHDALRIKFDRTGARWNAEHMPLTDELIAAAVHHLDLSSVAAASRRARIEAACDELQRSLDIERGVLVKAAYFDLGGGSGRLLLIIHHLVMDWVSWRIVLADLERACRQVTSGQPITLPPKVCSYQQWGDAVHEYAHSDLLAAERGLWLEQLADDVDDFADLQPHAGTAQASIYSCGFELDQNDTRTLLTDCAQRYGARADELLLSALAMAHAQWRDRSRFRVEVQGHGREDVFPAIDVTETVGWFTTAYPMIIDIEPADAIDAIVDRVKRRCRAVPNHGFGFTILTDITEDPVITQRDRARRRNTIGFNYRGRFDNSINQESAFTIASESKGCELDPREGFQSRNLMEVIAMTARGKLSVKLMGALQFLAEAEARSFLSAFERALERMIAASDDSTEGERQDLESNLEA